MTTRMFPRLARDRMALKLSGQDDRLRRADFKALAATAGLRAADAAIDDLAGRLAGALDTITLPPFVAAVSPAGAAAAQMKQIVSERIAAL